MAKLQSLIIDQKSGQSDPPSKFEDHSSLRCRSCSKKQKGLPIAQAQKRATNNVINLMDAFKASLKSGEPPPRKIGKAANETAKPKRKAS
jgi:non-homologous end joining protein Ku